MTVERIGPLDPASNVKKTEKPAKLKAKSDVDSINVSEEARSKAEVFKALEAAKTAPDVRMDRVEEVRRKLQDPSYPSQEVIERRPTEYSSPSAYRPVLRHGCRTVRPSVAASYSGIRRRYPSGFSAFFSARGE